MGSKLQCGEATPMEETVEALLDTLVAPLLARSFSNRNRPAESLEQSIGKQMHAVVLLYNYFHRKQFPEVEFLDYPTFIKSAVIAKKKLLSFVNCGQAREQTIVEKMMMDAFDICDGFNALTTLPSKDSWPVLKVSVLLVDTSKQNFLLQFGSVIHGVWSMIENDITIPATHASGNNNLGKQMAPDKKIFRGTQQSKQVPSLITLDEEALLQVAYSAVHEKTGLDSSSLMVLQGDYVRSLSKCRSTTRFYLMQCLKEAGEQMGKVPIKDALNSLHSPIVAKVSEGYGTTEAVTFFQLFPYEKIILDWISSKNLEPVVGLGNIITPDNSSYSLKENKTCNVPQLSVEGSKSLSGIENHATNENDCEKDIGCGPGKDKRSVEERNISEFGTKESPMRPQIGEMSTRPCGELGIDFFLQDKLAKDNLSVLHFEDHIMKQKSLTLSKEHALLQTAIKVLHKKHAKLVHEHQQLVLKQREVQDDIAVCEKKVKTIMEGGNEAFTFIIETVIEGCNVAPSEEETLESYPNLGKDNKRKRLSEAILNLCSPCQELDKICSQNNWVLPAYTVSPSKGGFVASVTVHCLEISSADGNERSKPQEARESAASCMLKKLRDMADHV